MLRSSLNPFLFLCVCVFSSYSVASRDESHFRFTQDRYNASITENAPPRTYVSTDVRMGIFVQHAQNDIKYRILSGDHHNVFKVKGERVGNFHFLRIRTRTNAANLNREHQELFSLVIKAVARNTSPRMTSTCEVKIHILDSNDLKPLFYRSEYSASVREDRPLHYSVTTVSASDADLGLNAAVYYRLSTASNTFAVHPTTGVVTLTRRLKYMHQKQYELDIEAHDRGPHRTGSAHARTLLKVKVTPVNFNAPTIRVQHLPALLEHAEVGTVFAILYINDLDYSKAGQIGRVDIVAGDPGGFFRIQKGSLAGEYKLDVVRTLDRETRPAGFNLTVTAWDRGSPPANSSAHVLVGLDTNDLTPHFTSLHYRASIDESAPVGTPVIFVQAKDDDVTNNGLVRYSIVSGNDLGWFTMNEESGLITVASELDSEVRSELRLLVRAEDQGNPGTRKSNTTDLIIKINDNNDFTPSFNDSNLAEVSVPEGQPVGTKIYRISAFDLDMGENGYVSYSISNSEKVPFRIDAFSGSLFTTRVIDYDTMRRTYILRIRVSDWGKPYRREAESILKINIKDVNDNIPLFEKIDCMGYLYREAPLGTHVVTISAIDFDAGNIISYHIESGNDDNCFDLVPTTGVLKLRCNLRHYRGDSRSVRISAFDQRHKSLPTAVNLTIVNSHARLADKEATVLCKDTDATDRLRSRLAQNERLNVPSAPVTTAPYTPNRHPPFFPHSTPLQIRIPEAQPTAQHVLSIQAQDLDEGFNGKLVYVISGGNEGGHFNISTYSGELTILSPVDRENQQHFSLDITVRDLGRPPRFAQHHLLIEVDDVNDNAPHFSHDLYDVTLSEDVQINTTVLKLEATDEDEGSNAKVEYSLDPSVVDFGINPRTGVLYVARALDRERHADYHIRVKATDGSSALMLTGYATVKVKLRDINDVTPEFVPKHQRAWVREDTPVGAVVLALSAHDPDEGAGGEVRYEVQNGADEMFEVDTLTGILRLVKPLDYEMKQLYNISVKARDNGTPSLSAHALVTLEVSDVNENLHAPKFQQFVYQGQIPENAEVNTTVMTLSALDDDVTNKKASALDYTVTYSVAEGSGLGYFSVDNKGVIRTSVALDRETSWQYWLKVRAQDRGIVPQHSFVWVYIEVEDVNDNIPQTVEPVYYPEVPENAPAGTKVVELKAFDKDERNKITFEIENGDPQGFFDIDRNTGVITTASSKRSLNRENQEEHILEVVLRDNGTPLQQSTTRVVVKVTDVNDNSPIFNEKSYRVRVPRITAGESENDVPLLRVVAVDADEDDNAKVRYSLKTKAGNRFRINPENGMIYSTKELLVGSSYELTVTGTDSGKPPLQSSARVSLTVNDVPSSSPNAPRFQVEGARAKVLENELVGHMIATVNANDIDGDKLWYSITAGNHNDAFCINPEHGSITLCRNLDWEQINAYNLTVQVTDGVHRVSTWIYVTLIDVNDNRPIFERDQYVVHINENASIGDHVLTVKATDKDQDKRLFYTIFTHIDVRSRGLFHINSETGVVTTQTSLDREIASRHELIVMVRDQGARSKRAFCKIVVILDNVNDCPPVFLQRLWVARVYDTAAIGTHVMTVTAVDRDRGENATLTYSILSGNVGNVMAIDASQGSVTVARSLHNVNSLSLVLRVSDGAHSATTRLNVDVRMPNNAPARFVKPEYSAELKESSAIGSNVLALSATSSSSLYYEIENDQKGLFHINPSSGLLTTNGFFDYETETFYNLTVRATNMAGSVATCYVMVYIIDENDNAPSFIQPVFYGNISESAAAGSMVIDPAGRPLVVRAADPDHGHNAQLHYRILESNMASLFDLDASTGAVRTRVAVDHEVEASRKFSVQVFDNGEQKLSAFNPAEVIIYVNDVNDSPPEFSQVEYSAHLRMPTYLGVKILKVTATDKDEDASLVFRIANGDGKFVIDSVSGQISVGRLEQFAPHEHLTIEVTDGVFTSQSRVIISVIMQGKGHLAFTQESYHGSIRENVAEVQPVAATQLRSTVMDRDVTYEILNPHAGFIIGPSSGVIQTTGVEFDREATAAFTLLVEARRGKHIDAVAHALVNITVEDSNDNVPRFLRRPYVGSVSVKAKKGDVALSVQARDPDSGPNGNILYSLLSGGERHFRMQQNTGRIVLRRSLVLEDLNQEFELLVQARDQGMPPMSATTTVQLTIMSNDIPIFEKETYDVQIPEDLPLHSTVATIRARSPSNHKLLYSLVRGDIYEEFGVDFNIGAITLTDLLDFETRQEYSLIVRATDVLTSAFAEAVVQVSLKDVNDLAPSFTSLSYVHTVSEALPPGASAAHVSAHDGDQGANGDVTYRLAQPSEETTAQPHFRVDAKKGTIYNLHALDYETATSHKLVVIAEDAGGSRALSSSVLLTINVNDINDNPPRFHQTSYDVTVSNLVARKQFVTVVKAHDPDKVDAGNLAFGIVSGNNRLKFVIEEKTGIIRIGSLHSFSAEELYKVHRLNVSVTDGVFAAYTEVRIRVESSNAHAPRFENAVYDLDVAENGNPGYLLSRLKALDEDDGEFGEVVYAIESPAAAETFRLEAHSGALFTSRELDREKQRVHNILVSARDGGGLVGFATVRVNVADKGDQIPKFLLNNYKANVYANFPLNVDILQVKAQDRDIGSNARIFYSIFDNDKDRSRASTLFKIEPNSGILRLKASASGMENQLYQFFVRASDRANPPLHSDVSVEIYIMSSRDVSPYFLHESYSFFAYETKSSTVIATVTVEGNETVEYSIVPGLLPETNNPPVFRIDQRGAISVIDLLDREVVERFTLIVRAQTLTSPALVAHAKVTIQVNDVNDNSPMFELKKYEAQIAENVNIGSRLLQVRATDKDAGRNAQIMYGFAPESRQFANTFSIDSQSGWISTLVPLDRESRSTYKFNIVAQDGGDPVLSDASSVEITILDHNDEPPIFARKSYHGGVNENASKDTVILSISSTDKDAANNANVHYHITAGDPLSQFEVKPSGDLVVDQPLDREDVASYQLEITASDGLFLTKVPVFLQVFDDNDNAPACSQPLYEKVIAESANPGTFVARIGATDADEKGTRNSRIAFSINSGDPHKSFNIHKSKGILSTRTALDRETESEYKLEIKASDGLHFCTSLVYVTVTDVNDNAPEFVGHRHNASVREDAVVNTMVAKVTAVDRDLGINRKVRYVLHHENGHFKIDPDSGIVSLKHPLDRERRAKFNLTIYAHDQGAPKMMTRTHLSINVLDVNDNPPVFEFNQYHESVSEAAQMGNPVVTVFASSVDEGQNAAILYSLVSGNDNGQFHVDGQSGLVSVASPLDYEKQRQHILTVLAQDRGEPPLSSTAMVVVNVTDENDQKPSFGRAHYTVEVSEAAAPGPILHMEATDDDSPPNARLSYKLLGEPTPFTIDHLGKLELQGDLDRELMEVYSLTAATIDSGKPALTGTTKITVKVTDVNDCPPKVSSKNYTAVVQVDEMGHPSRRLTEDFDAGYKVIALEVSDDDLDPNGPPFAFDIIAGNPGNEFTIDKYGVVRTGVQFDRQIKDSYDVVINIVDNGMPSLHTTVALHIKIIEESAHPPVVFPLVVEVVTIGDEYNGGILGKVIAKDSDYWDSLQYGIASENMALFDVHASDGTVTARQPLDVGNYAVNISVSDRKYVSYAPVTLKVRGLDRELLKHAVTLRVKHLPSDVFWTQSNQFRHVVAVALGTSLDLVHILSIQPALDAKRLRRSPVVPDLDVLLAAHRRAPNARTAMRASVLRRKLQSAKSTLQRALRTEISRIRSDGCARHNCAHGACRSTVNLLEEVTVIVVNGTSFVLPRHELTYRCECKAGFGGELCDSELDACSPEPCPSHKICVLRGILGYSCECPEGQSGSNCDQDCAPGENCAGSSMTFTGQSYAVWKLHGGQEKRLSLSLELKTVQNNGRLMHSLGRIDYSILEVIGGYVQYRFDCGSGEGLARVSSRQVNDGLWHRIHLVRNGREAKLTVDDKFFADARVPGVNDFLNLNSNRVFLGAEVEEQNGYPLIRHGFDGCMRELQVSGLTLPLAGSNLVATLVKTESVEQHCRGTYVPGICSSSPCLNGGRCVPSGVGVYRCLCKSRFIGTDCEIDTNPCASKPCLHDGACTNLPNDFRCSCKAGLSGKQCEFGFYCNPNPCRHSSKCLEGKSGPICRCNGFEGDLCETDINECKTSGFCQNGGTCTNTRGGFQCACPATTAGLRCEELQQLTKVTASPWGISLIEIAIIVGVLVGLLLLALILGLLVRWYTRRRRVQKEKINSGNKGADEPFIHRNLPGTDKHRHKMNNMDVAHQYNPNLATRSAHQPLMRPVSYSPQDADAQNALHNYSGDYGSAGDELEQSGALHQPIPDFLTQLGDQNRKPPTPPERNNLDNPNESSRKHRTKIMPTNGGVGLIDEDEPGYHWDTSDWAPQQQVPNITEVPMRVVPDSPNASHHSNEENTHVLEPSGYLYNTFDPNDPNFFDYKEEYVETDYNTDDDIGDASELLNEAEDYNEDPYEMDSSCEFLDAEVNNPPSYRELLATQGLLDSDPFASLPRGPKNNAYNKYLPRHTLSTDTVGGTATGEINGNASHADDVPPYGFPARCVAGSAATPPGGTPKRGRNVTNNAATSSSNSRTTPLQSHQRLQSDVTINSQSDISGICDISESEDEEASRPARRARANCVNLTSVPKDDTSPNRLPESGSARSNKLHTQV